MIIITPNKWLCDFLYETDDDLCVLDGKDGMGSAAGIMVVGCRGDAVGNALLQKVHGLFAVWDHMLWQVWLEKCN